MKYKRLLIGAFFCMAASGSPAQTAVREWTDYQSHAHAKNVVDAGDKIYCATEGGLFLYSKTDNSIRKMSGISGLSDNGIQRIDYSKENNVLLIAYQNANIDILAGNDIFNLSDIKRKQIPADKTINNVLFSGNLAYLSCGFGIVVVNLEQKEIKDTYYIGNEGGYLSVSDMATDGTYLYAATVNGVYRARASEPNLQNYNNWIKETSIPHADQKFSQIEFFQGRIIANYTPDKWYEDEMYQLNGTEWTPFLPEIRYVADMTANGDYLVFAGRETVLVYNNQLEKVKQVQKYTFSGYEEPNIWPLSAKLDAQNILWIADQKHGLIKLGTLAERIVPEGPADNRVFSLTMNGAHALRPAHRIQGTRGSIKSPLHIRYIWVCVP